MSLNNDSGDSGFYWAPRDSARIAAFWRLAIRAIRDSNNPAAGSPGCAGLVSARRARAPARGAGRRQFGSCSRSSIPLTHGARASSQHSASKLSSESDFKSDSLFCPCRACHLAAAAEAAAEETAFAPEASESSDPSHPSHLIWVIRVILSSLPRQGAQAPPICDDWDSSISWCYNTMICRCKSKAGQWLGAVRTLDR